MAKKAATRSSNRTTSKKASPQTPKKTTPKKTSRKKQAKQPYCPKGYTPDQYAKFLSEKARLSQLGNQELKNILMKNMQTRTGNKDDLVLKVADGIVLGRIPKCPKCFGGRPKFDYKAGTYYCSGYRDDEDFKNCHTTFTK